MIDPESSTNSAPVSTMIDQKHKGDCESRSGKAFSGGGERSWGGVARSEAQEDHHEAIMTPKAAQHQAVLNSPRIKQTTMACVPLDFSFRCTRFSRGLKLQKFTRYYKVQYIEYSITVPFVLLSATVVY